jgi:hypothetical protein
VSRQLLLGMPPGFLLLIAGLQFTEPVFPESVPHSSNCIPDSGCPKDGIKNENCCMEPPCETKRQIKIMKAFRILRLGKTSSGGAGFNAEYNADVNKIRSLIPPCEETADFRPPPPFRADPKNECKVSVVESDGSLTPITQDEALQEINSCAEVIKAHFAFAEATQSYCERIRNREKLGDSYKLSETSKANQAQLDSLDADFLRYFSVCSIAPDSELAREIADATISALLNGQPTEAPKKSPPGKSRNSGKRAR